MFRRFGDRKAALRKETAASLQGHRLPQQFRIKKMAPRVTAGDVMSRQRTDGERKSSSPHGDQEVQQRTTAGEESDLSDISRPTRSLAPTAVRRTTFTQPPRIHAHLSEEKSSKPQPVQGPRVRNKKSDTPNIIFFSSGGDGSRESAQKRAFKKVKGSLRIPQDAHSQESGPRFLYLPSTPFQAADGIQAAAPLVSYFPGSERVEESQYMQPTQNHDSISSYFQGFERVEQSQPAHYGALDATSFGADPSNLSRAMIHRLSNRSRSAISRSSRETNGLPRRRKNSRDKVLIDHQEETSPEEIEYRKNRHATQRGSPVAFKPEQATKESLSRMGPALVVTTHGMSNIILDRLRQIELEREHVVGKVEVLARMKVAGIPPRFENREQEDLTMKRVEQLLSNPTARDSDLEIRKGEDETLNRNSKHEIPEVIKDDLVRHMVSGFYNMRHPAVDDQGDVLGHVGRLANRNGSYRPADEQSLLRKIQTLLPAVSSSSVKVGQRA